MKNRFLLALQFLTVFTLKKDLKAEPSGLAGSMAWFPLIGAIQGLILVTAYYLLTTLLPDNISCAIVLLVLILTNAGLHMDGFADTVDGLAGGSTPEERLRIMRDSAVGAIGVVFVVLLLLIKFLALQEMPFEAKPQAIFLFPVAGRWAMVPLACWANYARREGGLGLAFSGNRSKVLAKATLFTAALSSVLIGLFSLLVLLFLGVIIYLSSRFFKRKLGGVTGDVYGFHSEAAEALFLLAVLALFNVLSMD